MGVKDLWSVLEPAGHSRSFLHLAVVDGFEANTNGKRAYRVGIDASLWYNHVTAIHKDAGDTRGANPELCNLFYKLVALAKLPLMALFVFDGRERPAVKRGSRMGKAGSHGLTQKFKEMLDLFGMEWRMARGEAEAELAYLNRQGIIDAVISDDSDTLVFGAKVVMKNSSLTLSGNKSNPATNKDGKPSKDHVMMYNADEIEARLGMGRGGLILYALLSGGDYDKDGVRGFGEKAAYGLARCGFGDDLLKGYQNRANQPLHIFLKDWRRKVNQELRENNSGHMVGQRKELDHTFPNLQILKNYADPMCSSAGGGGGQMFGVKELNLPGLAAFCEAHFDEWGHRSHIVARFRLLLWLPAVMRTLRRAALVADGKERDRRNGNGEIHVEVGTQGSFVEKILSKTSDRATAGAAGPSRHGGVGLGAAFANQGDREVPDDAHGGIGLAAAFSNRGAARVAAARQPPPPLPPVARNQSFNDARDGQSDILVNITLDRSHVSTDNMPQYRVAICPTVFVALTESGLKGTHPEPNGELGDYDDDGNYIGKAKKQPPKPDDELLEWIPASMMRQVHPGLVEDFESGALKKRKGKGKARARSQEEEEEEKPAPASAPRRREASAKEDDASQRSEASSLPHDTHYSNTDDAWFDEDRRAVGSEPTRPPVDFMFRIPNPDNPDAYDVVMSGDFEEHARPAVPASQQAGPSQPRAGPSEPRQRQTQQRQSLPHEEDDQVQGMSTAERIVNQALMSGGSKKKGRKPTASRAKNPATGTRAKKTNGPGRQPRARANMNGQARAGEDMNEVPEGQVNPEQMSRAAMQGQNRAGPARPIPVQRPPPAARQPSLPRLPPAPRQRSPMRNHVNVHEGRINAEQRSRADMGHHAQPPPPPKPVPQRLPLFLPPLSDSEEEDVDDFPFDVRLGAAASRKRPAGGSSRAPTKKAKTVSAEVIDIPDSDDELPPPSSSFRSNSADTAGSRRNAHGQLSQQSGGGAEEKIIDLT